MPSIECTVCSHPEREAIDEAIIMGQSYRSIAPKYDLNRYAVGRHAKNHVSPVIGAVRLRRQRDLSLLHRIEIVIARIEELADNAHEKGKADQLIAASRELRELYKLVGKLTGELDDRPQVINVLVDPTWLSLRGGMLRTLESYPEARTALAGYLEQAPKELTP